MENSCSCKCDSCLNGNCSDCLVIHVLVKIALVNFNIT